MFKLLSEEYQLITLGCTDGDYTTLREKTNGSAVVMLPKVDINTHISVSSGPVRRMVLEFGATFNSIVLVSSHISATKKEQKQVALALLNSLWKKNVRGRCNRPAT